MICLTYRLRRHPSALLATLVFASFTFVLQQTMVIPALPTIQRELHTTPGWTTWVLTAFFIVSAVAIPMVGRLGDQHGKERLLLISIAIFMAGSIGSALAWDIWALIGFRGLQGIGGGILPLAFSIVKDELPRERLAVGLSLISGSGAGAGGLGLVLSGVLIDLASWRWLFIVGAAPSIVALVLVRRFVPRSRVRALSGTDFPGAILLSVMLVCLLVGLTEGGSWGWGSPRTAGLFAAAAAATVAWIRVESRSPRPMVDMKMLSHRPVLFANLASVLHGFAMTSTFVLVANFVQAPHGVPKAEARLVDYGLSASGIETGLILLPSAMVTLVLGMPAGVLVRRCGPRVPFAAGLALMSAGIVLVAMAHDTVWQVMAEMTLVGTGAGLAAIAVPKLITDSVRETETGVATAINFVLRTIGTTIGAQVGATLLAAYLIRGTSVPAETGYVVALWIAAAAGFVAVPLALLARHATGAGRGVATPLRRRRAG